MSTSRAVGLLCLSAIAFLAAAAGCSQPALQAQQGAAQHEPASITVAAGRQWRIDLPARCWDPIVLAGPGAQLWALCHVRRDEKTKAGAVIVSRLDGKSWTPWADAALCSNVEPMSFAAALDGSGNPVVVWQDVGREEPRAPGLFSAQWSGQAWTKPERLATLRVFGHASPAACTDSRGNVHLAYQDRLKPPESYSVRSHGEFPEKNWHMILSGRAWSRPTPTTGPGPYNASVPRLTAEPDGKVYLVGAVCPFTSLGRGNHYIGCQAWNGSAWSEMEHLTSENLSAGDMASMAVDAQGAKSVTWWGLPSTVVQATRKQGGKISPPEIVAPRGSLPVLGSSEAGVPLLAWHADGSIHVSARGGDGWTPEVGFPAPGVLSELRWARCGPATMLLHWAEPGAVRIAEVLVQAEARP